jgi:ATP-dependent helicase HrpB
MTELPIDAALPAVLESLHKRRGLVLVAPPGAGKSTRVPPGLLAPGLLDADHPGVVLLQPRRVAARAVAARIAQERGWRLGHEVGYHVRFDRRVGPETRLRVLTEGVLTRQLLADPFLEGVGAVVLDEFHERSLHTDLALALLREVRDAARADLRIVVMSATLDPGPIARFLGDGAVVEVDAPTFPVEVEYRPPESGRPLPVRVAAALRQATESDPRDALVFLPGMAEIRACAREIEPWAQGQGWVVLPLHGSLSAEEQDRALRPAGGRKVVLATNVAETSLTIEGIGTVIDSGLARFAEHDPATGLERLRLGRISRASARQRAGRAGRTGPGRCIRLWSPRDERAMLAQDEPEVRRADLAATVLGLHAWGCTDPRRFGWFEPPPAEALDAAERVLTMLGALDPDTGRITAPGRDLMAAPAHPRIGRLLVAAVEAGRLDEGAALAALLAEGDAAARSGASGRPDPGRGVSDLLNRLDAIERRGPGSSSRLARARDEMVRVGRRLRVRRLPAPPDEGDDPLLKLVLRAYPDRVCRRRAGDRMAGVMVGGRGVRLDPSSVVRDSELFLALDPREERRGGVREATVRTASAIRAEWLAELFPEAVREERAAVYDEGRAKVVGLVRTLYHDLVIREEPHAAVDPETAATALAEALAPRAAEILRRDEDAAALLDRIASLRQWRPDLGLPEPDDAHAAECLRRACWGCRGLDGLHGRPLAGFVRAMLDEPQARALDELAPETIRVPSGSRVRLRYEPGRPPVLAVRLQELFGWTETPRIAGGRVPVLLHLLGPNFRPVQVTDDLRSFWANTYARVRKDLRARYPKHAWPDDPATARPEAKGRRS